MYVYAPEGQVSAQGPAMCTPLVLDLAMLLNTFNGQWDRDNIGPIHITSSSTIETKIATQLQYLQPAIPVGTFSVLNDGRRYLTNCDVSITTQDSDLILSGMSTIRIKLSTALVATGGIPPTPHIPLNVAFGCEVDGRLVYWSGYKQVHILGNNLYADIGFPRFEVHEPVGAGAHLCRIFYDFILDLNVNTTTATGADACLQRESFLSVFEARR